MTPRATEQQFLRTQFSDQMTVKHPALGAEWRLDVINEQVALRPVIGFKLKRLVQGEFLFMMAKDYMVPPEDVVSAKALVSELYPQSYARRFAKVEVDAVREIDEGQWEADYRFVHDTMGLILKRERVKIVRTHVLLASAEGWPKDIEAHAEAVAQWMTTTYAPLDG